MKRATTCMLRRCAGWKSVVSSAGAASRGSTCFSRLRVRTRSHELHPSASAHSWTIYWRFFASRRFRPGCNDGSLAQTSIPPLKTSMRFLRVGTRSSSMFSEGNKVEDLAARLAGEAVAELTPVERGRNSRVFSLRTESGRRLALKLYPNEPARDRLGTEFNALTFLMEAGIEPVPRPVACDAAAGAALYTWIDGSAVQGPADRADAAALARFLRGVHE